MSDEVKPLVPGSYNPDDLYSSLEALDGAKVEFVGHIPAEVSRQVSEYLLLRIRKGKRQIRLMLVAAEINRPCPAGNDMWDLMETFFTAEEIRARYQNQALELPKFDE